jgi:trimethylamine--corrinoid protein Co-methyltransferase
VDEASLAFDAHLEVGHGGHFFGAAHTLERFRECFHRPLLASTSSYERWKAQGSLDAAARADRLWREALDRYEAPGLPPGVAEEMAEFVGRRRAELGD